MIHALVRDSVLLAAKLCGGFALARWLTRGRLRIIGYHGISLGDEHRFRSKLFMRAETFAARLAWLRRKGYPLVSLEQGLALLDGAPGASCATVVTIDDGWYGTYAEAVPALERAQAPATLYVTTYYMETQDPVFDVAVGYLLWASTAGALDLGALESGLQGTRSLDDLPARAAVARELVDHGNARLDRHGRAALLRRLARVLEVDLEAIRAAGRFRLMSAQELADAASRGLDIQLHTHRHRLSTVDRVEAVAEVEENRRRVEAIAGQSARDFCYPSGVFNSDQWPWLTEAGVRSATCTFPGLCTRRTPRLALPRLIDDEDMGWLEFEAEVSGFMELVRWLKGARYDAFETRAS